MDSAILEYSVRSSKKIDNEFGHSHLFQSQSGQGNRNCYYKSIFARSSAFWSKLDGQVWRHDISIVELWRTWKAACYTGDRCAGLAALDTFIRKDFHCNSK